MIAILIPYPCQPAVAGGKEALVCKLRDENFFPHPKD